MKPTRKTLVAAGLLTFVAGCVLLFPARVAYHWFVPAGVSLSGISGSVWAGSAQEFSARGVYLRDLNWRLRPARLVTGRVVLDIDARPFSGFIETRVALGFGNVVVLSDLNGSLPLQAFESATGMPGLRGTASVQVSELRLHDGVPTVAIGTLAVAGLVAPKVDLASIGGYRAEFGTVDDNIVASVEDTDGVFDLAGSLQFGPDRGYVFTGLVAPTARTPARLREQMQFLGTPNSRGQYELRFEGRL